MGYDPIPDEELEPQTRSVAVALPEQEATMQLLRRLPDVAVFGLLLVPDPRHPVAKMLRARWSELHHLTGRRFLLVAFEPPPAWTEGLKDYWREQLGDAFDETWARWQRGLDPGLAYDYLGLFSGRKLRPSELPCLALFTDPEEPRAVVRPLPDWDEDSLFRLMASVCEVVEECADLPKEQRLARLEQELTAPGPRFRATLGHAAERALAYLKEHPAQVAATVVGFVVALGTSNVLPLGASLLAVLKAVKDALGGGKDKGDKGKGGKDEGDKGKGGKDEGDKGKGGKDEGKGG